MKLKTPGIVLPQQLLATRKFLPFLVIAKTRELKLITVLFFLLINAFNSTAQTNFTLTQNTNDLIRPGAGATLWNNQDGPTGTIHIPVNGSPQEPKDYYYRFSMTHFFSGNGSDSTINFSFFRARFVEAINKRQGIRFRVMTLCNNCAAPGNGCPTDADNDCGNNKLVAYNGGNTAYPKFLHDLMQTESPKDWFSTQGDQHAWVPNWNSPHFHRWIRKLSQQLRNYIDTASHNGYNFRDAFRIYDLGYYGSYGEQHSNTVVPDSTTKYPSGTGPTTAGLIAIVDAQTDAFGGSVPWKIVIPFNAYDCELLPHTWNPIAYGQYLLDHPDSIGYINDHLGADEEYDHHYLENNNRMGGNYNAKLMNRWKFTPHGGEPVGFGSPADRSAINSYVNTYHLAFFGNGNLYPFTNASSPQANNIRLAAKNAGYRIRPTSGSMTTTLMQNASFNITMAWRNEGSAPAYDNWDVIYQLKTSSGTEVQKWTSSFDPRYFLPSGSSTTSNENFSLGNVTPGITYKLTVKIIDPTRYYTNMPLFITNTQESDTSYLLRSNITVQAGGNQSPTASAGNDQSIQLPTSSTTLTGSGSDADGTIASHAWAQVSGPSTASFSSTTVANPTISALVQGSYTFRLTVTDNQGATATDDVVVTVAAANVAPTSNAGTDKSIQLPTSSVNMAGSGTDPDGTITAYLWTQVSGPSTASYSSTTVANPTISALVQGSYTFRLRVTDNLGATATDDVVVTVAAASGGPVYLTWETPIDSDYEQFNTSKGIRKLSSSPWSTNSGIVTAMQSMEPGDELFAQLYLSTNTWAIGLSVNKPLANVYGDPTGNTAAVFGYVVAIDADKFQAYQAGAGIGTQKVMASFEWVKIVYSTSQQIIYQTAPASAGPWTTLYTSSVVPSGPYHITFHGVGNGAGPNEIYIVKPSGTNQSPTSNAGTDKSIQLPTSSVNMTGSGTDPDGTITAYLWTQVSGPSTASYSSTTVTNPTISALVQGSYTFRLRVTDNLGATATDDVVVTVAAANVAPTSNAGTDKSIQLPTSSVNMTGSGTDPDGTITAYLWTQVSGPSTASYSSTTVANPTISALVQGSYTFRLRVTDNLGATATDDVVVTVAAANVAPTSNAGTDKSIQLPTSSVNMTGSGTDPDGTITAYLWTQVSGPSTASYSSTTVANPTISALVQGSYTFRLRVTDNLGATATDDVVVTVAAANVAPTSNAGTDKSIQLPTSSVNMTGSGTDPDGTITAYLWTQVSGPSTASYSSTTVANPTISALVQGSYTFRLRVTDNLGATATDDVVVTVAASSNPVYLTWVTPIDSDYEQFNSNKGIRKLSSSSWSTSSGTVKAIQTLDPGDELIAQLYLASNSWAIGLTKSSSITYVYDDPTGNSNCPFGYVVAIDGTNIQAYQAGAGVGTQRSMTNFYWVKIAYSSSNQNIVYSTASSSTGTWTTLYTSATVPSGSYNIFFQGIGNGAGPNEIYINKGTVARPGPGKPTVVVPSFEPAGVNLAPNPVSSTLKININSAIPVGKSSVRIYSQNGQLVYKEQFVRSQQKLIKEVDVSKYTGGIYYVYVNEGEKKSVILRFLKN